MGESLKTYLNRKIKEKEYMTLDEVHRLGQFLGYKQSNIERQLRASASPDIASVKNKKGHIIGYRFKKKNSLL